MADKTVKESQESPHVAQQKTPEQIAAEIVGNGRKPVILAILTVLVLGIVLAVGANVRKKSDSEAATQYEKLDAIVVGDRFNPAPNDAEALTKKISELDALIKEYSGSNAAIDALYYKGKFQHDSGDYAAATKTFEEFVTANPTRTPYVEHARLGAANAKMNMGTAADLEAALKQLDQSLAAISEPLAQDRIRYQMGLCNAMLGNDEKAKTILKGLVDTNDGTGLPSSMKESAERLLGLMRVINKDEIAKLAKEFPASQIKPAPPKEPKADKEDEEKAAPTNK